jgi:hypothetical protein
VALQAGHNANFVRIGAMRASGRSCCAGLRRYSPRHVVKIAADVKERRRTKKSAAERIGGRDTKIFRRKLLVLGTACSRPSKSCAAMKAFGRHDLEKICVPHLVRPVCAGRRGPSVGSREILSPSAAATGAVALPQRSMRWALWRGYGSPGSRISSIWPTRYCLLPRLAEGPAGSAMRGVSVSLCLSRSPS